MSKETVLDFMIQNDLKTHNQYMISHHVIESPSRIDVKSDEVIYIDKITINSLPLLAWLEFHSATESRIVQTENYEQVTRHKGHIYFNNSNVSEYIVSFVKLRLIDKTVESK